ncbi:MAG: hypothetical protein C4519_13985 [Desulfobacteraceae bacterium]|nr:MAG: hypothetical protein C4519_13985 [Desulfobacteraceae bacterium]
MKTPRLFWILVIALLAGCRSESMGINVDFGRPSGLAEGDRVLFEKNEAGHVRAIQPESDGRSVIGLSVDRSFSHALTQDSSFYVIKDPVRTGSKAVDIRLNRTGGPSLSEGATVDGVSPEEEKGSAWGREVEKGFQFLERRLQKYGHDLRELPESAEYRRLKKTLREWAAEMERAGEKTRVKIEKHWLPRIRQELEAIEEWIREPRRKEDRHSPEREGGTVLNV